MNTVYNELKKHLDNIVVIQRNDLPIVLGPERLSKVKNVKLNLPMIIHYNNDQIVHIKDDITVEALLKLENINK